MILSEFQQTKSKIEELAQRAFNDRVMSEEELRRLRERLAQEKIIVGICGQVKTGKTSFINSLLFGKNILPVASTPMTASLCYISYGDSPEVEVEFFTKQEWEQLIELAKSSDKDIAQSAREFIESSRSIQNEIQSLLGTRKIIDFSMIGNFVGSQGRYTPLVKSLKIKLPEEILRGIEIVDTPGINDPIVSRERRAIEFLQGADVVFLFIYAGRPFDESDMKFFRRIKNSVGKVVIVVNKKDEILSQKENQEGNIVSVIERVKSRIIKNFEDLKNEAIKLNESKFLIDLIENAKNKIVFFSSLWALLGKMKESEIYSDEDLRFHYERFKDDFPMLKSPDDFLRESGIYELENAIREILKDKFILLKSTTNQILNSYNRRLDEIISEIDTIKTSQDALKRQLGEIQRELDILNKIDMESSGRLEETVRKIMDLIIMRYNSINLSINQLFSQLPSTLERIMPDKSFWSTHGSYQRECEVKFETEFNKNVQKINEILSSFTEINDYIQRELEEFFKDAVNLASGLLITKEFFEKNVRSFKEKIFSEIIKIELLQGKVTFQTSGWWCFGSSSAKAEILKQAIERVNELQSEMLDRIIKNYDKIRGEINSLRERFKVEISDKIKRPIQEAMINYNRRDEEIKKYSDKLNELEKIKSEFGEKLSAIKREIEAMI
ncbi:MAG: dynamin family protein [Thermoplasmata archaeon]